MARPKQHSSKHGPSTTTSDLLHAMHVPEYLQNPFITAGYRFNYHWRKCVRSIFSLHNETWNVWTHFIGFFIFAGFTIHVLYNNDVLDVAQRLHNQSLGFLTDMHAMVHTYNYTDTAVWSSEFEQFTQGKIKDMRCYMDGVKNNIYDKVDYVHSNADLYYKELEKSINELQLLKNQFSIEHTRTKVIEMKEHMRYTFRRYFAPISKLPLIIFLLSGMICFLGSTLFHTFGCHSSKHTHTFFLKVDYSGIAVLIAGSEVPFICYIFNEVSHWRYIYLISLVVISIAVMIFSFAEKFSSHEYQPYRAALFVLMGCSGLIPFAHMMILFGGLDTAIFYKLALSVLLYLVGVGVYVSRLPERWCPGKFDIWLHSHQVFHTFIVAAAVAWYMFTLQLYVNVNNFKLSLAGFAS